MKIFSLETKKHLVGWSVVLGLVLFITVSFLVFIKPTKSTCADTCTLDIGWPVIFGNIGTQQWDKIHSQPSFSFKNGILVFNKIRNSKVPILNIEVQFLTRQEYFLFSFVQIWILYSILVFIILSLVRHFRKKKLQVRSKLN